MLPTEQLHIDHLLSLPDEIIPSVVMNAESQFVTNAETVIIILAVDGWSKLHSKEFVMRCKRHRPTT